MTSPTLRLFLTPLLACVLATACHAMSVRAPEFRELVAEANIVARARVKAVESRFVTGADGQQVIKTFVHFTTLKTLKGEAAPQFTLELLGGRVGTEAWSVPGMPTFAPGDEEFVFTSAERNTVCPLVGAMHGRYRVETDSALRRRYIARDNHTPLLRAADVSLPPEQAGVRTDAGVARALSPEEFEAQITAEVQHPSASVAQR